MSNTSFHEQHADHIKEVMEDFAPVLAKLKKSSSPESSYLYARQTVDNTIERSGMEEKTTCSSSCSFCCHDTIYVSHSEGDYIKKVIAEKGIVPNADRLKLQKEGNPHLKWAYKACPLLLDEDESGERKCSIYKDRPLICRTHNSTEDPKFCNKEDFPDREIKELKIVLLEGIVMSSLLTGNKQVNPAEEPYIALHDIL
jgi:Fe-S-cluster containining protein